MPQHSAQPPVDDFTRLAPSFAPEAQRMATPVWGRDLHVRSQMSEDGAPARCPNGRPRSRIRRWCRWSATRG